MFHVLSTLVLLILAAGVRLRRRPIHVYLMMAAFALDLASVLAIELSRGAIRKVVSGPSPLLQFHVAVSMCALICYGVMWVLGQQVRQGAERLRPWHRRTAWLFGACRAANYVTSWMV